MNDKLKLTFITVILDILFVYILKLTRTSLRDEIFIGTTLIFHTAFYYALWNYQKELLKVLHVMIYLLIAVSLYVDSVWIQKICLGLSLLIKYLWETEGRCILKDDDEEFGFGEQIEQFNTTMTGSLTASIISKYNVGNHWLLELALNSCL